MADDQCGDRLFLVHAEIRIADRGEERASGIDITQYGPGSEEFGLCANRILEPRRLSQPAQQGSNVRSLERAEQTHHLETDHFLVSYVSDHTQQHVRPIERGPSMKSASARETMVPGIVRVDDVVNYFVHRHEREPPCLLIVRYPSRRPVLGGPE
ncbi:hypothetical protein [Nocardia yamanashiensis]|uniref:hypothetical protein n=1 Tax=Nocardia yamanashiensis TaxID=209247 RepID=UPI0012FD0BA7|nr:hypothetical protein [Nocardia yamanashiensis]